MAVIFVSDVDAKAQTYYISLTFYRNMWCACVCVCVMQFCCFTDAYNEHCNLCTAVILSILLGIFVLLPNNDSLD